MGLFTKGTISRVFPPFSEWYIKSLRKRFTIGSTHFTTPSPNDIHPKLDAAWPCWCSQWSWSMPLWTGWMQKKISCWKSLLNLFLVQTIQRNAVFMFAPGGFHLVIREGLFQPHPLQVWFVQHQQQPPTETLVIDWSTNYGPYPMKVSCHQENSCTTKKDLCWFKVVFYLLPW